MEAIVHFMSKCFILSKISEKYFGSSVLEEEKVINIFNGENWFNLVNFSRSVLKYR